MWAEMPNLHMLRGELPCRNTVQAAKAKPCPPVPAKSQYLPLKSNCHVRSGFSRAKARGNAGCSGQNPRICNNRAMTVPMQDILIPTTLTEASPGLDAFFGEHLVSS